MANRREAYSRIIEDIFFRHYKEGDTKVRFTREEIVETAKRLEVKAKNPGDVIYSFRYRTPLPESIRAKAPDGFDWVIRSVGRSVHEFDVARNAWIFPNDDIAEIKILDATPGMISRYAIGDEQSLLAKLRYNRLIDVFTGVTCYSLQSHLRATVKGIGQVETDEVYVGVDRHGVHHVFPVQAKGGSDWMGIVQIEQDFALCNSKFPRLVCVPIAAQFMDDDLIAMFAFEQDASGDIAVAAESHYRLVPTYALDNRDLESYQRSLF